MKDKILEILENSEGYVSGTTLSKELSVSRTAVWKHIKKLREEGYRIVSVTNKGYLLHESDVLNEAEIRKGLKTEFIGANIVFKEETDSTNNEAKRSGDVPDGTLFIAEIQNGGRGRLGREWLSAKDDGIWMSLVLRPDIRPEDVSEITLVAGLAVCRVLSGFGAEIKWPNDIVIGGKKICGILTELSAEIGRVNGVVTGIGINVNTKSFPVKLRKKATSLYLQTEQMYSRAEIVRLILEEFEALYTDFLENGLQNIKSEYNERCANVGKISRAICGDDTVIGTAKGINDRGALLLETEDGELEISSGEVSVRGIYGYV